MKNNIPYSYDRTKLKARVKVYDSIYSLPAYADVKRSNKDLALTLMTETKNIEFRAKPKLTNTFKYVNLCLGFISVINYGIDLTNKKRFYYGKQILLNTKDSTVTIIKTKKPPFYHPKTKGEFDLHLSLPYVNSFNLKPLGEGIQSNTGFMGIAAGLDYYHRKNQFLSLTFSGALDFIAPFPAPFDWEGEHETMYTSYIGLSNNHKIKRFSMGYGLVYAKNTWNLSVGSNWSDDPPPPTREPAHQSYNALGLVFPTYFQLGKAFNIGVIYRPTFYRFTPTDQWAYEHLISLDFAWKIKL